MPRENESSRTSSSRQRVQIALRDGWSRSRDDTNPFISPLSRREKGDSAAVNKQDVRVRGKDRKEIEEERRLLGDIHHDPHAISIAVPGGAPKPKTGSIGKKFESFNPIDSLSSRMTRTLNRSPRTRVPNPKTHDQRSPVANRLDIPLILDGDNDGPPRKRHRTNMPKIIDLEDDDNHDLGISAGSGIGSSFKPQPGPTSLHSPGGMKNSPKYSGVESIRKRPSTEGGKTVVRLGDCDVDEWDNERDDEEFVKSAQRERFKRAETQALTSKQYHGELNSGRLDVMSAVEIPKLNKTTQILADSKDDTRLSNQFIQTDGRRRNSELRESPDELQGGKTVGDSWKMRAQSGRQISPSNIRHTRFSPSPKSPKKWDLTTKLEKRKNKTLETSFRVRMFHCGNTSAKKQCNLVYTKESSKFCVKTNDGTENLKQYDLKKAIVIHCSDDNKSAKLRLQFPNSQNSDGHVYIEFLDGRERNRFCKFLEQEAPTIKRISKPSSWMDKVFSKAPKSPDKGSPNSLKRQSPKQILSDNDTSRHFPKPKRTKLNESLLDGGAILAHGSLNEQKRQADDTAKPKAVNTLSSLSDFLSHSHPPTSEEENFIPVKTYNASTYTTRETRSKTRNQDVWIDSDSEGSPQLSPVEKRIGKWTTPLVYPPAGKKKAEVDMHDLDRLRDNEFLNDNLIAFYIRFLEYHLERQHPDVAKRVYFFNSYFFASLTNTSKGQKGINYEAVQKWTRSVDIFSFDYIVVPINENAHWYVAIICNLPNVLQPNTNRKGNVEVDNRPSTAAGTKEDESLPTARETTGMEPKGESGSSNDASEDGKDDNLQKSFISMALADDNPEPVSLQANTDQAGDPDSVENLDWPEEEENQKAAPVPIKSPSDSIFSVNSSGEGQSNESHKTINHGNSHTTKKRGQKPRNSQPKCITEQATIITFDSLSCSRTPAIKIIREYLEEEAKSKRSFTLDTKNIKGMNAQRIPRQSNFSDCGLYLLAYLEKFVQNPDSFITKLLRKVMDENKDWPEMKPGLFRRRLRKFLFELFDEQQKTKEKGKETEGNLLVDKSPLNILLMEGPTNSGKRETKTPELEQVNAPGKSTTSVIPSSEAGRKKEQKRDTVIQQTTPSRSSPRLNRKVGADKGQPSPSIILEDENPPAVHDSVLGEMEAYVAEAEPKAKAHGSKSIRVEVPETPPPPDRPATPETTEVDSTVISSPTLSSPSRHSKRNLEREG